jgi:hypothetical protein
LTGSGVVVSVSGRLPDVAVSGDVVADFGLSKEWFVVRVAGDATSTGFERVGACSDDIRSVDAIFGLATFAAARTGEAGA